MAWVFLDAPSQVWLHAWKGTAADLADEVRALAPLECHGIRLRWLRGSRMRTKAALLEEWAAAAQFPPYFGGTWDAFRDALSDLPGEGAAFFLLDADQLLQEAPPEDGETFRAILGEAATEAAPRPFHVILQAEEPGYATLLEGLRALGQAADEV